MREVVKNGQRKGAGLAGAGLRDAEKVAMGEKFRDGACLDWRRHHMAAAGQGALERLGKAELGKCTVSHMKSFICRLARR